MTGKSDFTEEEWNLVVEAPPTAADRFARPCRWHRPIRRRGRSTESELLDELVSAKPEMDHTRYK